MQRRISICFVLVISLLLMFSVAYAATTPTPTARPAPTPTPTPVVEYKYVRVEFQYVPDELMPDFVTVQFLRNGNAEVERKLDKSNNWQTTIAVSEGSKWQIMLKLEDKDKNNLQYEYFPKSSMSDWEGNIAIKITPAVIVPAATAAPGVSTVLPNIDVNQKVSIKLHVDYEEKPVAGANFKLYKIADMNKDLTFTVKSDYKDIIPDASKLLNPDNDWLQKVASSLRDKIVSSKAVPIKNNVDVTTTDVNGNLTYAADDMKPGIYLAIGAQQKIGNYVYTFIPGIITVPTQDDSGKWVYHRDAIIKRERVPVGDETYVMFEKIWDKDDGSTLRPTSIDLLVLLDGKQHDRITLNASNGWKTSKFYSGTGKWEVQEVTVPKGYIATYNVKTQDNVCDITVVNSYQFTTPTPTPTKGIPQTGMVWWPVILMAVAGAALFTAGLVIYARGRKNGKS